MNQNDEELERHRKCLFGNGNQGLVERTSINETNLENYMRRTELIENKLDSINKTIWMIGGLLTAVQMILAFFVKT